MKEIIRKIEESDKLDFETKLIALCEIDRMIESKEIWTHFGEDNNQISIAFSWTNSNLGFNFWADINIAIR